jgi:DNA-binding transcriptional MerR regulator
VSRISSSEQADHSAAEFAATDSAVPRYPVRVVADRVGMPIATLRSWNRRYGVGPSTHSPGRHRLYSEVDIAVVQQMQKLIHEGASPSSAARAAIDSVPPGRADADSLLAAAMALDSFTASLLLDRYLRHLGVVDTWNQLIRPTFAAIEAIQAGGNGCIDVEHALSWAVSRSLQRLPLLAPDASASIILTCTAGETHTLALEALRGALGERGRAALMLGADVPLTALRDAIKRSEHPVTVTLWSQAGHTADPRAVKAVLAAGADAVIAGPGWRSTRLPRAVLRVDTLRDAVEHFVSV